MAYDGLWAAMAIPLSLGLLELIFVVVVILLALANQRRSVKAQEDIVRLQQEQVALLRQIADASGNP